MKGHDDGQVSAVVVLTGIGPVLLLRERKAM